MTYSFFADNCALEETNLLNFLLQNKGTTWKTP